MKLKEYLEGLEYEIINGDDSVEISEPVFDSRKITENSLFLCIKGANFDGHDAIPTAVSKNAAAVIVEKEVDVVSGITMIKVKDSRYAMAIVAANYYGKPSSELKMIGITGTKGKTTTTYLIKSILENAGLKVGLIGTIEVIIGDLHIPAVNTTPDSYILQKYLRQMVDSGIEVVVMEVSSQALMLHRTAAIDFDFGIFTNLSEDHIGPNEHRDFNHYLECKRLLFKQCKYGIFNSDDKYYEAIKADATCKTETYGIENAADIKGVNIKLSGNGKMLGVSFETEGLKKLSVTIRTPGKFSVYNALCAIAVCNHFNIEDEVITKALLNAKVKGRIEHVDISDDYSLIIDYAHNAMALKSLLETLREYDPKRLICLFGCGGNRAKSRRYEMGAVSSEYADLTIITSDNPRNEDPNDIIADIISGFDESKGKYIEIPDRKEAIRYAINNALPGDIIVLAGKGHEDYQEINGIKYPMDERILIKEILSENEFEN